MDGRTDGWMDGGRDDGGVRVCGRQAGAFNYLSLVRRCAVRRMSCMTLIVHDGRTHDRSAGKAGDRQAGRRAGGRSRGLTHSNMVGGQEVCMDALTHSLAG